MGSRSAFGERPRDEQMQEALRKARRRAAEEERARHAALTHERRLREWALKALREKRNPLGLLTAKPDRTKAIAAKLDRSKLLAPKPHPWQVEAREHLEGGDAELRALRGEGDG